MAIPEPGWEEEGRRLSPLLDTLSAVVIVGADSAAAAMVAVGAARAQAERRRVVIGDLVGDLEPLESMIPTHDPHGLADSFTYGISLNRIGYPVAPGANLFIMPSGSEPVATSAVIGHPRWLRLVAGFREVGALLVLVAEPKAPALEQLIPMTDGALLVGDTRLESPAHVIARARPGGVSRQSSARARGATSAGDVAARPGSDARAVPARTDASPRRERAARADATGAATASSDARPSSRRTWAIIGMTLAAALVALAGITATQIAARRTVERAAAGTLAPPVPAPAPLVSAPAADPPPPVENPLDSARASAYAVVIVAANTAAGADDNLRRVSALPAATAAPSVDGGVLWYKVFVGAFDSRAGAEALRDSLRVAGGAGDIVEPIVSLPFALLVADRVPSDSVAVIRERHASQGVSTYALVQDDGTSRLFAGAFATPEEAMHLAPQLRTAGIQPRIVYRTGRAR